MRSAFSLVSGIVPIIIALAAPGVAAPAKTAPNPLTIAGIMRGPDLYGTEPGDIRWSLDSSRLYFRWKEPGEPRRDPMHWYRYDNFGANPKPRRLTDEEAENEVPPAIDYSDPAVGKSGELLTIVFERNGDLYQWTAGDAMPVRLTDTPAIRETDPAFAAGGKRIVYRDGNNLFYLSTDKGEKSLGLQQLTDIREGNAPKNEAKPAEGVAKIASDIEKELFDTVRAQAAEREKNIAKQKEREAKRTRVPFYLGEKETVGELVVSPAAEQVLVLLNEPGGATPSSALPLYITDDGFVAAPKARPNVGWEKPRRNRCVLLEAATGKAMPVTLPDSLKDRKLAFLSGKYDSTSGRLALLALSDDWHDRWIFEVDTRTGKASILDALHDNAWIDGPSWDTYGWSNGTLYFITEASGWARLVTVAADGTRKELSPDKSEASDVVWRPTGNGELYFTSSAGDLGQRHFDRVSVGGGSVGNLTPNQPGWNEANLSPDGQTIAVVHSYTNKPPELFVRDAKQSTAPRQITVSPSAEFRAYPWRDVPVVQVPARDGIPVYARLFTPTRRTKATGAAVVFVHGAGYLQNADKGWTEYPREYMFAHFLAERGYTVLDIDYRGSAGYGRDFRTGIYKHMGGKDLSDVVDCVRWLEKTQTVDPKRVGIYGGSYGGFLSLMALFTEQGTFRSGAALRPVTDWTKYNNGYTGRILGLPQDDLAAYRRSSPIFFAEGLRGSLLICHGMRDDNVFFQDTVRLTERLIELGKTEHFSTAMYPVESHSFTEPASWTDEYTRIFNLFEQTIGK